MIRSALPRVVMLFIPVFLVACTVPIAAGLDERDANQVADALNRSGIDATKEADPGSENRYRVSVPRGEAAPAIAVLRENDLPPRHAPGVVDAMGKGALVPSPLAEHAQYVAGVAGDLERSLASVDGVLGARVHLSIPTADPLSDGPARKPTASVLLKHLGSAPPLADRDVKLLVAGAVSNLALEDVTVVMVSRPAVDAAPVRPTVHFGPITVARTSAPWLRGGLALGLALLVSLLAAVMVLWFRMRRFQAGLAAGGENA